MSLFHHLDAAVLRAALHPLGFRPDPFGPRSRFRLGLNAAAPAFLQSLDVAFASGCMDLKLQRSLLKYQLRASGRCTPYGSFAGLCLVKATDSANTQIVLAGPEEHRLVAQLDAALQDELAASLTGNIAAHTRLRRNSSLYHAGAQLRYARARAEAGNIFYDLSAAPFDACLLRVLEVAGNGAAAADLVSCIIGEAGVSADEALAFLNELISAQLIQSALAPQLTGADSMEQMVSQIRNPELRDEIRRLQQELKSKPFTHDCFERIHAKLDALLPGRDPAALKLQLDMHLSCRDAVLSRQRLQELTSELEDLSALAAPYHLPLLDDFKLRFAERYSDEAVPLLQALDPDLGVGYGPQDASLWTGALLAGLPLPSNLNVARNDTSPADTFIRSKFLDALRSNSSEILISAAELKALKPAARARFPKTQSLMGAMQHGATTDDWQFALDYAGGASAISLLARFCNGDESLHALAGQLAAIEAEAEPECVLAEIVHLPAATLGNVSRRPVFHKYEIPYLGVSGAAQEQQLDPQDLLLQLHNGELCLFSKRLQKRVLPRLSSAHNFAEGSLPLYRLLCELQFQGLSQPVAWNWGIFRDEPFLPAVRYGHIRICKRSWSFERDGLKTITPVEFTNLLRSRGLPERLRCGTGDQQLLLDLREPDQVDLLLRELRSNPKLRIEEALHEGSQPFVRNAAGEAFANELIIPVVNSAHHPARAYSLRIPEPGIRRCFAPGAGLWHYLKLYCGYALADDLLHAGYAEICESLINDKIINGWFFLRYTDPEPHLRLRFLLSDEGQRPALEAALQSWIAPALEAGTLHRVVVDTYERELERYGAADIELVEALFFADSRCTLAFLCSEDAPEEPDRFRFACRSIDALLEDAGLQLPGRSELISPLARAFFEEHGGGIELQQSLNEQFRKLRSDLEFLVGNSAPDIHEPHFADRSQAAREIFGTLDRTAVLELLPHLIHLLVNRVFGAGQRRYELLIYHCLAKQYSSLNARSGRLNISAAASGRLPA